MSDSDSGASDDWDDDASTQLYQRGLDGIEPVSFDRGPADSVSPNSVGERAETWYVSVNGQDKQALSAAEVVDRCRAGTLSQDTLVWHEGLEGWTQLRSVPELSRILGALTDGARNPPGRLPPLPRPPSRAPRPAAPLPSAPLPVAPIPAAPKAAPFNPGGVPAPRGASGYGGSSGPPAAGGSHPARGRFTPPYALPPNESGFAKVMAVWRRLWSELGLAGRAFAKAVSNNSFAEWVAFAKQNARSLALVIAACASVAVGAFWLGGRGEATPADYNLDDTRGEVRSKNGSHVEAPQRGASGDEAKLKDQTRGAGSPAERKPLATGPGFDEVTARGIMAAAAQRAQKCGQDGGPTGAGEVKVRIEPDGSVSASDIGTEKFKGTSVGVCIRALFLQSRVPPFGGRAITVVQKFKVPE